MIESVVADVRGSSDDSGMTEMVARHGSRLAREKAFRGGTEVLPENQVDEEIGSTVHAHQEMPRVDEHLDDDIRGGLKLETNRTSLGDEKRR